MGKEDSILERTSTDVYVQGIPGFSTIGTDEIHGTDHTTTHWFNLGEYVKDIDFELLPQDPLLDDKFPRPLVERGYCYGIFDPVDNANRMETGDIRNRDCESGDYLQPLSDVSSSTMIQDRQKNIFKVALYYLPDESVITEIKRDSKMTLSDKISWIGGMMGLFTGFSVISAIEILYWLWFKVLLHEKDHAKVEPEGDPENTQATDIDVNERINILENELKNIKMSLKGGQADNNYASAALFDAIFEDPEAKELSITMEKK